MLFSALLFDIMCYIVSVEKGGMSGDNNIERTDSTSYTASQLKVRSSAPEEDLTLNVKCWAHVLVSMTQIFLEKAIWITVNK